MDLQPWMGQLTIAGVALALLLLVGRSYVKSVETRVTEYRTAHREELERLRQERVILERSWEDRLTDMRTRAEAWEAAANRREETTQQLTAALGRVESVMAQNIALLAAIREGQKA